MRTRYGLVGVAILSFGLAACGGGGSTAADAKNDRGQAGAAARAGATAKGAGTGAGKGAGGAATSVKVATSGLGPILTDQEGRTLYAFTRDKNGNSNCADACIATWPALTGRSVQAGPGTTPSLLGKTQRTEGTAQAVYGDWPLYYYAGDGGPGDVNGQGVDGVWFVVNADGKLVRTSA